MRLGYVNYWFVEVLGSHDQFAVTNYWHLAVQYKIKKVLGFFGTMLYNVK
jgi:hypothetical protein